MRKFLTYYSLIMVAFATIFVFMSVTAYSQLVVPILLFPLLAYFAFEVFPSHSEEKAYVSQDLSATKPASSGLANNIESGTIEPKVENEGIANFDKRAFLKIVGAAGISLFLYSILIKRGEIPFFSKALGSGAVTLQDSEGNKIDPAEKQPTDGYSITEIDDSIISYFGFTNKDGAWFIMREDTDNGSFRYTSGKKNFSSGWDKRENLTYDYFNNVFK